MLEPNRKERVICSSQQKEIYALLICILSTTHHYTQYVRYTYSIASSIAGQALSALAPLTKIVNAYH